MSAVRLPGMAADVANLLLGPLVRFTGERDATVWVETDAPCEVGVLGHRARTFEVHGHHYALVVIGGLEPGTAYEYDVTCDGVVRWPDPGSRFPPSAIRTLRADRQVRLLFGSCRAAAPHVPPFTLTPDESEHGREQDALRAYALRMADEPSDSWPDAALMLGDQVYADEASPATREFARSRRDTSQPPGEEIADFEEYTRLYRESWSDEAIRWFFSTVPALMIFDDHDVNDDWNISAAWKEDMHRTTWWHDRIVGAFMSYWLYQHLGNLSPHGLDADDTWNAIRSGADAATVLRDLAVRADRTTSGTRWSFHRDFGPSRVVVVDSRAGRHFEDGRREMVDDEEWRWVVETCSADVDHLLIATSLPALLAPGIHGLEAWNEAVCAGVWGRRAARVGERVRRALDLEHWAAFQSSFRKLVDLLCALSSGARGRAPQTIVLLSGDVHYSYLAAASDAGRGRIYQAVCSPIRNPLARRERRAQKFALSRTGGRIGAALMRSARVAPPALAWRVTDGPWFDNCIGSVDLDGPRLRLRLERAAPALVTVLERDL